ncbi:MAG: CotH kinase family protein [Defluviitaleaceae bacterium]|nr:CotH kinase family protein [Defluviitaleaceae bacterium]
MFKKILVIAVVVAVLAGVVIAVMSSSGGVQASNLPVVTGICEELTVTFSVEEAFHTANIEVELTASNPNARIFYTLDGSTPTTRSRQYSRPIRINVRGSMNVTVVRAIAVYDGYASRPVSHTYFMGRGVHNRFDTMVFSLSTTPSYLFDHHDGIFVAGAIRDEFIRQNPGHDVRPPDPANFNLRGREAERPLSVEVFSPDGERLHIQNAGARVHGGWSRAHDQKSIRLVPRREYTPETGTFRFDFFPWDLSAAGQPIVRYDNLILRNSGNDNSHGMIRNEVGSVLALEAGFLGVTPVRPVAVFLNGEYYGFAWLQVRFTENYMERLFDAPERSFDIVGMGERWLDTDDEEIYADLRHKNSFGHRDLTDDAIFAQLEEILDVDNMLFYFAFQIFMGQHDWPHNNLRRWRYTGEQVEELSPYLDGRWRYLMFDLDWTLGLYGDNYRKPTFQNVLEGADPAGQRHSDLLIAILQRPEMQERFTMIMNDLWPPM